MSEAEESPHPETGDHRTVNDRRTLPDRRKEDLPGKPSYYTDTAHRRKLSTSWRPLTDRGRLTTP